MDIQLTRLDLYNETKEFLKSQPVVFIEKSIEFIKKTYPNNLTIEANIEIIHQRLRNFQLRIVEKLNKHFRHTERFLKNESIWLNSQVFEQLSTPYSEELFQPKSSSTIKRPTAGI